MSDEIMNVGICKKRLGINRGNMGVGVWEMRLVRGSASTGQKNIHWGENRFNSAERWGK